VVSSLDEKIKKTRFLQNAKVIKVIFGEKNITNTDILYFSPDNVVNSFK
jgi:hypothetical protein